MKKILNHIYTAVLVLSGVLILAASCGDLQEQIDWDSGSIPAKLIVEGQIDTSLKKHEVSLKMSADYFINKALVSVSGATVFVKGNGEEVSYQEDPKRQGIYVSEKAFRGVTGKEYSLHINLKEELDGETVFVAKTQIVEGMKVDKIDCELLKNPLAELGGDDEQEEGDTLTLFMNLQGQEPSDKDNYYFVKYYMNDVALNDTSSRYEVFSDNETETNGSTSIILTSEESFRPGDKVTVELYSITEHYFWFLKGISQITQEGDPLGFGGAPANAVGNVNNGALGYFLGAEISRISAIIPEVKKTE